MQDIVKINQNDNVAVALRPLNEGETLDVAGEKVTLVQDIPQGHKFALRAIAQGEEVVKYGFRIGYAKEAIEKGAWVHVHNVKTALGDVLSYEYKPEGSKDVEPSGHVYFDGYRRADGKVGIRNEIWIVPTVGCVNSIAKALETAAKKFVGGNVEDIIAFQHPYGCSQMGDDQENTRKVLADMIHHDGVDALSLQIGPHSREQHDERVAMVQIVEHLRPAEWEQAAVGVLERG